MYTKKLYNGTVMCYDRALSKMPTAQAGVFVNPIYGIVLMSYRTVVLSIDPDGWMVCTGLYSATTRKHISAFLKEYAPTVQYSTVSDMVKNGYVLNIHTGEIQFM